jgi:RNA polymerase sigma-70 factor (family 1)
VNMVFFSFNMIKDKREAEDIVQEAFLNYWNRKNEISQDLTAIKSFLYTTVKNASLNLLRHQKVIKKFQDQLPQILIDDKSILNSIIQAEVISKIHNALESLPAGCQQISRMSYLDDKNNNEIALELGISVNTVKTQKQRAMQILRQKLTPEILSIFLLLFLK